MNKVISKFAGFEAEIEEYEVCVDCAYYIAYGEFLEDICDRTKELISGGNRELNLCMSDKQLGFSWRPCECCHRDLAGDRLLAERLV